MALNGSSYGNYGEPRHLRPRTASGIDTNKLMRTSETEVHTALTAIVRATEEFKKTHDFEFLNKYVNAVYNRLEPGQAGIVGDFKYNIDKMLKSYASGMCPMEDISSADKFLDVMLQKRKLLEVKYLKKLLKGENGDAAVQSWLADKSDRDLQVSIWGILEDYKNNRTPENREKYNRILQFVDKKIVKIPNAQVSMDEKLVARFAFEGSFVFPTDEDKKDFAGYSSAYLNFINDGQPRHPTKVSDEEFYACPVVKAIGLSPNMAKLLPQLKEQLQKQGIDGKLAAQLNMHDVARVLFNEYGPQNRTPAAGEMFSFSSVNPECTEGVRQTFWKKVGQNDKLVDAMIADMEEHGVDKNYIRDLVANIRENGTVNLSDAKNPQKYTQPTPILTVHHKVNIKDAGGLDNVMDVDKLGNFTAYVDYGEKDKSNHELQHVVDENFADGFAERLVDLRDGENGENLILSCGIRKNSYVREEDIKPGKKRQTYLDIALESNNVGRA